MSLNWRLAQSIKGIQAIYDDVREYQPMTDDAFQCVANEIDQGSEPSPRERCAVAQVKMNAAPE